MGIAAAQWREAFCLGAFEFIEWRGVQSDSGPVELQPLVSASRRRKRQLVQNLEMGHFLCGD